MKELFSAFQRELFRPLVTLLIPGLIAIFPYLAIYFRVQSEQAITKNEFSALILVLIFFASLFVGMMLEEFGAHIESGWDSLFGTRHMSEWYWYLRQAPNPEPIAYRYIRSLVLRLKFLLASYASILIGLPGYSRLLLSIPNCLSSYLLISGLVTIACCLRREAQVVHYSLSQSRRDLMTFERLGCSPKCSNYVYEDAEKVVQNQIVLMLIILTPIALSSYIWPQMPQTLLWIFFNNRFTPFLTDVFNTFFLIAVALTAFLGLILVKSALASGLFKSAYQWLEDFKIKRSGVAHRRFNFICRTEGSDSVYVVGSIPELGDWDPERGLRLAPSHRDSEGCDWEGVLRTPTSVFEYKFFQKRDGSGCWEQCDNRRVQLDDFSQTINEDFRA